MPHTNPKSHRPSPLYAVPSPVRAIRPHNDVPTQSEHSGCGSCLLRAEQSAREGKVGLERCGGRGEPLVLLHPFALSAGVWKPILQTLERYHDVYALALPGHHGGDPVPSDREHNLDHLVDLLEAQLDRLNLKRAHLVGNSLGGWLALELARRDRALSVVAIAPGGGWQFGGDAHKRLVRRFALTKALLTVGGPLASVLGKSALARQLFLRETVAYPERLSPEDATAIIEAAWRCEIFDAVVRTLPTQPLSERLDHVTCPVRFVWGSEDRLLPLEGCSEHWRSVVPQATWVEIPGAGHVPMYDAPLAVAESILQLSHGDVDLDAMAEYAEEQRLVG